MFAFIIISIIVLFFVVFSGLSKPIESTNTTYQKVYNIDLTPFSHHEEVEVVGVHLEENFGYILNFVKPRHPVKIIPEPDNKYSERALKVVHEDFCIGYISENDIDLIVPLINQNHLCLIGAVDMQGSYLYVSVKVYFKE